MIKKIIFSYSLILGSILGWIGLTSFYNNFYGSRELGFSGCRQKERSWCVFACMETLNLEGGKRQCDYATEHGIWFESLHPMYNCCDENYVWDPYIDPIPDLAEAYKNRSIGCFNGVSSSNFDMFVSRYRSLKYLGSLSIALYYDAEYIRFPIFGILETGHCVIVTGIQHDQSYAQDGTNAAWYWDPDFNSMRYISFKSGEHMRPEMWGYELD